MISRGRLEDIRASARNSTYTFWAANVYDTVWAWALVLDNLTKTQESFEVGSDYGNLQQSEMIVEQFYRTRFQGVSGEISSDRDTGYTNRAVDITQVRNATPHSDQGQESTEFIFHPRLLVLFVKYSRKYIQLMDTHYRGSV